MGGGGWGGRDYIFPLFLDPLYDYAEKEEKRIRDEIKRGEGQRKRLGKWGSVIKIPVLV